MSSLSPSDEPTRPPGTLGRLTPADPLLTPAEVASLFRVDPKTVTRWAKAGKLNAVRTLGGHRRYRESEVKALLDGQATAG
jgi:excisionase family DNA binding protein